MKNKLDRLAEIKEKIDELKQKKAQIEGSLEVINKQLKEEFGTDDIKKLGKLLISYKEKYDALDVEVAAGLEKLEEQLS